MKADYTEYFIRFPVRQDGDNRQMKADYTGIFTHTEACDDGDNRQMKADYTRYAGVSEP